MNINEIAKKVREFCKVRGIYFMGRDHQILYFSTKKDEDHPYEKYSQKDFRRVSRIADALDNKFAFSKHIYVNVETVKDWVMLQVVILSEEE